MILKLGSLKIKIGGKKPEPIMTDAEFKEFSNSISGKATMAEVLDIEGLLVPNNKFAGLTVNGVKQPDPQLEMIRDDQEQQYQQEYMKLLREEQRVRDKERKEQEEWEEQERQAEIRDANRQALYTENMSKPCPVCGSEYECVHKAIYKFRGDYGQ